MNQPKNIGVADANRENILRVLRTLEEDMEETKIKKKNVKININFSFYRRSTWKSISQENVSWIKLLVRACTRNGKISHLLIKINIQYSVTEQLELLSFANYKTFCLKD